MINRHNYLAIKAYLTYIDEVKQRDFQTIQRVWLRLKHLLAWIDEKPFAEAPSFRPVFPQYLLKVKRGDTGTALSGEGIKRICRDARAFFHWIGQQHPKEFDAITPKWIDTLNPPRLPAKPPKEQEYITLEMVRQLLAVETNADDIGTRRDRAASALLFLSGMRATAFSTLPIKCLRLEERMVLQYPTLGVRTKNGKADKTTLLDIDDLLAEVKLWDEYVRERLPDTAPWYSIIDIDLGRQVLTAKFPGVYRRVTLAKNIKKLFAKAALTPLSPHKFRHGHANYVINKARDVGDLKALSQNLMHANLAVTDSIYSILSLEEVRDRFIALEASPVIPAKLDKSFNSDDIKAIAIAVAEELNRGGS